ncbi:MAG: hypothetical protein ACXADA_14775 [Candidatus Hodarchaeales archaeon]
MLDYPPVSALDGSLDIFMELCPSLSRLIRCVSISIDANNCITANSGEPLYEARAGVKKLRNLLFRS